MNGTRAALFVGAGAFVFLAVAAAASAACTVAVALSPGDQTAWIDDDSIASVSLWGSYAVEASPDVPDRVEFAVDVSTGWVFSFENGSESLADDVDGTHPFYMTVVVPAGEPTTHIGEVRVVARAFAQDAECGLGEAVARITPAAYFSDVTMTIAPSPADVDPVTLVATVDLRLRAQTNADRPVLARLTVRINDGLRSDAPMDVQLTPVEPGFVGALVVVHFTAPNAQVRSYSASLFADIAEPTGNGTGLNGFRMYQITVRVPAPHVENSIAGVTMLGGIGSVIAVSAVWAKGRPGMKRAR